VRHDGYAVSDEELEIGLRSIALPLADSRGLTSLGLSVSLPAGRMTIARMVQDILPVLKLAKNSLEKML